MQLQSESLTEEFWVCCNSDCHTWERRSTVTHKVISSGVSKGFSEAVYAALNQRVFNSPLIRMMFDAEK
jgi:hypothetical protein